MSEFDAVWKHVHECDQCSRAERSMCREGERLLAEATAHVAEAMAPMPKEAGKA